MTPPDAEHDQTDDGTREDQGQDDPGTGESRRHRSRERASEKVERISEERLTQAREVAGEFRHKRDCPEEGALPGEPDRRVEHFPATKPRTEDSPPQAMLVIHCMECGESEVVPDESEAAV